MITWKPAAEQRAAQPHAAAGTMVNRGNVRADARSKQECWRRVSACSGELYRALQAEHVPPVFPFVVAVPKLADVAVLPLVSVPSGF